MIDALRHLLKHGVAWDCRGPNDICLDEKYQPRIGILDELSVLSTTPELQAMDDCIMVVDMLHLCRQLLSDPEECEFLNSEYRSARWFRALFGELMDAGHLVSFSENVFEQTDIPDLIPLSQGSRTYLHPYLNEYGNDAPVWSDVLISLASGVSIREGSILHADYDSSNDTIGVLCMENDGKTICHLESRFAIPHSAAKEIRERLGIAWGAREEGGEGASFRMQLAFPPGATSVESSGWFRRCPVCMTYMPWTVTE